MVIASWLAHRLAGPILGGASVLLALALGWQTLQLHFARGDLKDARKARDVAIANYTTCKASRIVLQGSLDKQNTAVKSLEAEAIRRQQASQKAMTEATKTADKLRKEAALILASKPKTGDLCAEADKLLTGAAR